MQRSAAGSATYTLDGANLIITSVTVAAGAAGRPTLAWASAAPLTTIPGTQATRFKSIQMGFLYVTIDGKKLTAEFVGPTGTDFTRVLNKP